MKPDLGALILTWHSYWHGLPTVSRPQWTVKPSSLPFPLSEIVSDVHRAFEQKLYYPALAVALTLPEICTALTLDNSVFIKEAHYCAFIDKYTTPQSLGLDGIGCYRLRGGVIHRGNAAGHPFFGSTHVIFTVPESRVSFHAFSMEMAGKRSAMFDLKTFINAMTFAVAKWHEENIDNQKVKENLLALISWRPDGLYPFVGGMPVVGSGE